MPTPISKTKYTSQYIDNMSFDDELKVSMVEIIGADGVLKNPATEEKQDDEISAIKSEYYDTVEVNKSAYPTITLTKKLSGATVSTKTVQIIG